MQHVGLPHQGTNLAEQALLLLGDLLHVVAFTLRRLVTIDVVDADTVGRRRQRACHRLQGAGADRCHDGTGFAVQPGKRRGGMGHLHLVAAVDGTGHAFFVIDPQYLAKICRAMPENRKVFPHALPQQAQNQALRQ